MAYGEMYSSAGTECPRLPVPVPPFLVTAPTAPQAAPGRFGAPRVSRPTLPRRPVSWRRDIVAALLWMVAVVPAAMGFWLVAGSLAGIAPSQVSTLISASLLGLGLGTLLQVGFGFRLPMYEGPAAAYLAA